ncbi:hypothetical protein [Halogranum rubrum]|uniref:Uncharacterized protein n=1 Tax=Halogranum salarium B-1 TaxID=1210908 RepID=J2ZLC5_9EURY|nr:hypothetical protein [Halogranum salarium]EJN61550.1 hypothetical protein HSB1_05910 [Halogranum salarium B-1]
MYSVTDDAVGPLRMRSQRLHPATTVTAVSDALDDEVLVGLKTEAADLGRFLGLDVEPKLIVEAE